MSSNTQNPAKSLSNTNDKDKLKQLITKDITQLSESVEVIKPNSNNILSKLEKNINPIDFQLLTYPNIEELRQLYAQLKSELFGETPIYTDTQSTEYKEAFKKWQNVSKGIRPTQCILFVEIK